MITNLAPQTCGYETKKTTMVNNDNDDGDILMRLVSDIASSRTDALSSKKRNAMIQESTTLLLEKPSHRRALAELSHGAYGRTDVVSYLCYAFSKILNGKLLTSNRRNRERVLSAEAYDSRCSIFLYHVLQI